MKERKPRRRSDKVRRKLNQESQSSIRQAASRVVNPPGVQPRGGSVFNKLPLTDAADTSSAV